MKWALHQARFKDLFHQRNLFLGLSSVLLVVNVIQAMALFFKSDHVVLLPPEVHHGFWVERGQVSAGYLEEMSAFFTHLVLDASPKSAAYQRDLLLRYTLPEHYGVLRAQLASDEARLLKENATTSFHISEMRVFPETMTVEVWGDLTTFVGSKHISNKRQGYVLRFELRQGRLFLTSFQDKGEAVS